MKLGHNQIEPGIYLNFCSKKPKYNEICGQKIEPGEWEYVMRLDRTIIYKHPNKNIYRTLMSAGPLLIVADMNAIKFENWLYVTTIHSYATNEPKPRVYIPYFYAEYPRVTQILYNLVYDGETIYLNEEYKIKAPGLGELLNTNLKEATFSHGTFRIDYKGIFIKWEHSPPQKPPAIGMYKAYLWY